MLSKPSLNAPKSTGSAHSLQHGPCLVPCITYLKSPDIFLAARGEGNKGRAHLNQLLICGSSQNLELAKIKAHLHANYHVFRNVCANKDLSENLV